MEKLDKLIILTAGIFIGMISTATILTIDKATANVEITVSCETEEWDDNLDEYNISTEGDTNVTY